MKPSIYVIGILICVGTGVFSDFDLFCTRPPPFPIQLISPEFIAFIRGGKTETIQLSDLNAADAPVKRLSDTGFFAKGRQVVFLIHGYFGGEGCEWQRDLKDNILKVEDSTVFVVKWSAGANNPLYSAAASNTQTIAAAVASVAQAIAKLPLFSTPKDLYLYCIGHSLGGQICGQAGRNAKSAKGVKLFDRVTGLDPAGPGFAACTDGLHVDTDSARDCVDCIHTDGNLTGHDLQALYFGTMKQWGNIDFYPNGGANQPACVGQFKNDNGCSHGTAVEYFLFSLKNQTACMAKGPCAHTDDIKSCQSLRQSMGYFSSCHKTAKQKLFGNYYADVKAQPSCKLKGTDYCPTSKPPSGFFPG